MQDNLDSSQHEVFMRYYSQDRHRIFKFIYSLLPNEADAEDAFQQTSIVLWKSFCDFDQSREFYKWACGVAYHAVQNFRRTAKRRGILLSDEVIDLIAKEQTTSSSRSRYRIELLKECIDSLKSKDQMLVKQFYNDQIDASRIAREMGWAVQTVYNRMNLIRKGLLSCVDRKSVNT